MVGSIVDTVVVVGSQDVAEDKVALVNYLFHKLCCLTVPYYLKVET